MTLHTASVESEAFIFFPRSEQSVADIESEVAGLGWVTCVASVQVKMLTDHLVSGQSTSNLITHYPDVSLRPWRINYPDQFGSCITYKRHAKRSSTSRAPFTRTILLNSEAPYKDINYTCWGQAWVSVRIYLGSG